MAKGKPTQEQVNAQQEFNEATAKIADKLKFNEEKRETVSSGGFVFLQLKETGDSITCLFMGDVEHETVEGFNCFCIATNVNDNDGNEVPYGTEIVLPRYNALEKAWSEDELPEDQRTSFVYRITRKGEKDLGNGRSYIRLLVERSEVE